MEQQIKEAKEQEERLERERRLHLKAITEQDRYQKKMQKLDATKQDSFRDDFAKHLHDRPAHQAYDRRAKQDNVVNYISEKFFSEP